MRKKPARKKSLVQKAPVSKVKGKRKRVVKTSTSPAKKSKQTVWPVSKVLQTTGILVLLFIVGYVLFNFASLVSTYDELMVKDPLVESNRVAFVNTPDSTIKKTLYIFEEENGNGVSYIKSAFITSFDEDEGSLLVLYIPGWVYLVPSYKGLGTAVSVGDLSYAGGLLETPLSYEYSIWEIENLTGLVIDRYVWVTPQGKQVWDEISGQKEFAKDKENGVEYFKTSLSALSISNLTFQSDRLPILTEGIYSNMDAVDIYSDIRKYSAVFGRDDAYEIDMSTDTALEVETTSGIEDRYYYGRVYSDEEILKASDSIVSRDVEKEQTKCEIYNASSIPNTASLYGRRIGNNGLRVVRTGNSPVAYEKTTVYISNPERFDHSVDLVKRLLPADTNYIDGRPEFLTTGDIVIVLGEDIQNEFEW